MSILSGCCLNKLSLMLLLCLYLCAVLCVSLAIVAKDLFILYYIRRALRLKLILWHSRYNLGCMARYTVQAATCKRLIKKYHLHTKHLLLASNNVSAFYKHINNKVARKVLLLFEQKMALFFKKMSVKLVHLMHTLHLFLMKTLVALSFQLSP